MSSWAEVWETSVYEVMQRTIRFKMNRSGNISLNGNYIVDSGEFVSKMILERKFQIVKGSNLSWTGNPMTPQLNIKATYEKVVTNMGEYLGTSLPSLNVQLITNITGTMNKPDLKFNIDIPEVSSQIRETLNTKISNEDERYPIWVYPSTRKFQCI